MDNPCTGRYDHERPTPPAWLASSVRSRRSTACATMANEAAKKRVIKNREVMSKYRMILIGSNVSASLSWDSTSAVV